MGISFQLSVFSFQFSVLGFQFLGFQFLGFQFLSESVPVLSLAEAYSGL
jgi:hypothetical protein